MLNARKSIISAIEALVEGESFSFKFDTLDTQSLSADPSIERIGTFGIVDGKRVLTIKNPPEAHPGPEYDPKAGTCGIF